VWEQTRRINLHHIAEVIGQDIRYFPVSAQNAMKGMRLEDPTMYEASGIPALVEVLSQYLVRERGAPRQKEYIRRADLVLTQLERRADALLTSLQTPVEVPPDERTRQAEQQQAASAMVEDYLHSHLSQIQRDAGRLVRINVTGEAERVAQEVMVHIRQLGGPEAFFRGNSIDPEKTAKIERTHVHSLQGVVRNSISPTMKLAMDQAKDGLMEVMKVLTDSSNETRHLAIGTDLIPELVVDLKPNAYLSTETVRKSREKGGLWSGIVKFFTGNQQMETYTQQVYHLDEITLRNATEQNLNEVVDNGLKDLGTQIANIKEIGLEEATRIKKQAARYLAERDDLLQKSCTEREAAILTIQDQMKTIREARRGLMKMLGTLLVGTDD
jgi:hypothetical protein